jgi:hypothetical protein
MEKEFIPYEQALALKELGFDEPCIAIIDQIEYVHIKGTKSVPRGSMVYDTTDCPSYSQVFRFFREIYDITQIITRDGSLAKEGPWAYTIVYDGIYFNDGYLTYEEAELECLKKLIEIVKSK